jgi:SAM-dependent methyltransferase
MDLKETDILGDDIGNHWYYSSKAKAMAKLLNGITPKTILDVGAGSAFFSRYLLNHTNATEAWCVDISYVTDSEEKEADKKVYFRKAVGPLIADLVLLMDVLEHVDDDVGLLSEYVRKVPTGSQFLISVPAFQFLWSGHDDFLEHKRRYTLAQLEDIAQKSGLRVKKGTYYFGAVFPIASSIRIAKNLSSNNDVPVSQLSKHSIIVNTILKTLCRIELPFMNLNRIAGLTVFCLAEKE